MNVFTKRLMSSSGQYINKKRKLASELLQRRLDDRKNKKFPTNTATIQVLGDGTQGTSPSLLLNSEGRTYLFNCNSGLQRACFSHRIRLAELEHIFLTNLSCDNISGVYGITLTVGDIGLPNLCIHSTSGIGGIFSSMNSFTQHTSGLQCFERKYPPGHYTDSGLAVEPIVIDSDGVRTRKDEGDANNLKQIIVYVCQLPDVAGALDPAKCKELKVPVGPMLAILKSGNNVTLQDGSVVRSSDVCEPNQPGSRFMIMECPTTSFIEPITACKNLTKIIEDSNQGLKVIDLVFHLTPQHILQNERYQEWMNSFKNPYTRHMIVSHNDSDRIFLSDFRRNQYLLHKLDDKIFPFPYFSPKLNTSVQNDLLVDRDNSLKIGKINSRSKNSLNIFDLSEQKELRYHTISALDKLSKQQNLFSLDRISFKPKRYLESPEEKLDLGATFREVSQFEGFATNYKDIKDMQSKLLESQDYEPEVTFLGTGSAVPSKYRNTSGILVKFPHPVSKYVIMDCGEDTYGQIVRLYGLEGTTEILRNLELIYVSHFHADHHVGLMELIQKRTQITDEPVNLVIPPRIESSLEYHNHNIEDMSNHYRIFSSRTLKSYSNILKTIDCDALTKKAKNSLYEATSGFLQNIDIVDVDHCPHACGVAFTFKVGHPEMESFKISYSGDCRPSEAFAKMGHGSDLLIHEATMDDRNQEDAEAKKHCTTSEAIDISRKMDAKYTILTHFSQRFAKIPIFTDEMDEKIGFAFDFLKLRCPSDYVRLSILKPILNIVYRESIDLIEDKFQREVEKKLVREVLIREQ